MDTRGVESELESESVVWPESDSESVGPDNRFRFRASARFFGPTLSFLDLLMRGMRRLSERKEWNYEIVYFTIQRYTITRLHCNLQSAISSLGE